MSLFLSLSSLLSLLLSYYLTLRLSFFLLLCLALTLSYPILNTTAIQYNVGDRVEGDLKGTGVWIPGIISCDREVLNFRLNELFDMIA